MFRHVTQETSVYELWNKLENMYQAKTSWNTTLLMRRLVNLKLQIGNTVVEHKSEFQNLVNQLASINLQFENETQVLRLFRPLPESWKTLVVSLNNSALNGKLTISMVKNALFNEEVRRREMDTTNSDELQALISKGSKARD